MRTKSRVYALTGVFALLGMASHVAGSGSVSAVGAGFVLLASFIFAVPVAHLPAAHSRMPALFVALLGGQLLMHVLMTAASHGDSSMHSLLPSAGMLTWHTLAAFGATAVVIFADSAVSAWSTFFRTIFASIIFVFKSPSNQLCIRFSFLETCHSFVVENSVSQRGPPVPVAA